MNVVGMKLGAVDLNLLTVFEAILHERSVTRAAVRLSLSQPAMSHALNRLRRMLGDQLFVRTPTGMVPTPRAETLAGPIREALAGLEAVLEPERFDPASASRDFWIAVNNYAAVAMVPALAALCMREAPNVRLRFQPSGTLDLPGLLDRGQLDLVVSDPLRTMERISSATLLADHYVAVTRLDHPAGNRELTLQRFAGLEHLAVSSSPYDLTFIDVALGRSGLSRQMVLEAPLLSTGCILAQSDLVAVLPANIARSLSRYHALQIHRLPCSGEKIALAMLWSRRLDDNVAHTWLRERLDKVCRELDASTSSHEAT
jgi:DNA-binding transcriptional LysR family regulator